MLTKLEGSAAASGIRRLVAEALPENARLLRLARGSGFQIRPDRADASLLQLEKPILGSART